MSIRSRSAQAWGSRALALCCAVLMLLAVSAARAASPSDEGCNQDEECRAHFVKGRGYYKDQDYKSALDEFNAAYARRQTPILLINIGRSLQKLGRPKEALEYYQRCQAATTTDKDLQEKLKIYIGEVQALLTTEPAEVKPTPPPEVEQPEPPPAVLLNPEPEKKPVYKKAWFWVAVVGAGVVVGGVTAGLVLGLRKTDPQVIMDPPIDSSIDGFRPTF